MYLTCCSMGRMLTSLLANNSAHREELKSLRINSHRDLQPNIKQIALAHPWKQKRTLNKLPMYKP